MYDFLDFQIGIDIIIAIFLIIKITITAKLWF